jgi:uncharacterized protein (DUF1778 family)
MRKRRELRDERITIRIPARLRAALERAAAAEMRSVSDVILLAVMDRVGAKRRRSKGAR